MTLTKKINYSVIAIGLFAFLNLIFDNVGFSESLTLLLNTTLQGLEIIVSGLILYFLKDEK
jgi:hypothetical protein